MTLNKLSTSNELSLGAWLRSLSIITVMSAVKQIFFYFNIQVFELKSTCMRNLTRKIHPDQQMLLFLDKQCKMQVKMLAQELHMVWLPNIKHQSMILPLNLAIVYFQMKLFSRCYDDFSMWNIMCIYKCLF